MRGLDRPTRARLKQVAFEAGLDAQPTQVLTLAAALQQTSGHPLAHTVMQRVKADRIAAPAAWRRWSMAGACCWAARA